MTNEHKDDICLECGHRRGAHDGAGCTEQLPDGSPCQCSTCIDMPSDELDYKDPDDDRVWYTKEDLKKSAEDRWEELRHLQ